ncbi:MAG: 2-hydroxyacyl-CoA dehydratase family protein [Dehalococcoidia bacterium]|nr:2-hydroxyacyl-CoA dehydratase family protein [Dehalococcoidia bacterium]
MAEGEAPRDKTSAVKSTQTARKVRKVVKTMYTEAQEAKAAGKPVAYGMMGSMYDEILIAMDVPVVWTENYAGLCATKQDAGRFLVKAENEGYSNVICGYARTGIGFDAMRRELGGAMPENAPDGGMPVPDMLLGSSCTCDPRFKWYQALGHYMDTPTYCHDVLIPPSTADLKEVAPYYVKYQVEQLQGLIGFLEKQTGRKFDYDKLSHHLALSDKTYETWWEIDRLRRAKPAPMASEDHFAIFIPGVFRLGHQETLDFYQELYAEIKDRVDKGIGVLPGEKYRLLWGGGLPPWHTMWMFNQLQDMGAVFAIENAYFQWEPIEIPVGLENPLEHLAWRTLLMLTLNYDKARTGSGNPTVERLLRMVKEYDIDGMVMHATRSCRAMTVGQIHLSNLVREHIKLPSLLLISDIVDLRDYSEAQWRMQIDSFMETVRTRKSSKG